MPSRLLSLALVAATLTGCATKRDLRDLRMEIDSLRISQEQLIRQLQRQVESNQREVLDTLTAQDIRIRGDFQNEFVQLERQLVQVQELTGQGQQRLAEMREELRAREEARRTAAAAAAASGLSGGETSTLSPADVGDPDELFEAATAALERGSLTTARTSFEQFVLAFPQHELAPEAQLMAGTASERADEPRRALTAYQRVLELFPNSRQAPTALYRAALIERERGNRDAAETMLSQLVAAYPDSEEVDEARERLRELR